MKELLLFIQLSVKINVLVFFVKLTIYIIYMTAVTL